MIIVRDQWTARIVATLLEYLQILRRTITCVMTDRGKKNLYTKHMLEVNNIK